MPDVNRHQFSDLEVINQAVTALGETELQNLETDEAVAAQVMRQHYVAVKEFCLTKTAWRFNTTKKRLSKVSASPLNRYASAYQLPNDCLKVLTTWPPQMYEINGQRIYASAGSYLEIDYSRNIQEAYWMPWFTRLVVAELVMRTCRGITGDTPDQEMKDERRTAESDALFQDATQQPNQTITPNDFIDARA